MVTNKMSTKKNTSLVRNGYALQLQRIQDAEKISNQEQSIKNDHKATLNATWSETLEEITQSRILKRKNNIIEQEVQLANKALTQIRRKQLQELLANEHEEYKRELNNLGLTFHNERI